MKYTPDEVFTQALADKFAGNIDGKGYEGRLAYGTKITRDNLTGEVEFFNTTRGGHHYLLLTRNEIKNFLFGGWKYGACVVYLSNNRSKLDAIERQIRKEVNSTNNPATLKSLQGKRKRTLERYNKVNLKLNSITNGTD